MLLPEEFNRNWDVNKNGPLLKFSYDDLIEVPFSEDFKQFLSIGGLPETPPPYLDFTSSQASFKPITSIFDMSEAFRKYWLLGSTGSGDPVCIIESNERIVYLDNGNEYKEVFINSSINQFAECILLFSEMIDKAIQINGEDAFIDNEIPEYVIEWLKEEFKRVDSNCIKEGSFWDIEIENLYE
ncbi:MULTISPECIES: SUKH-4 family immunity protein [Bacillus mojavensis subgroup]|uniref:SUKH-4 family immunity protein n=1 Tax=Bacillus mojavensis TaxID=72360 RepID=A0AAP3CVX0_BACMO|nr:MULTISPECIES: SUKH-4 family immunity protein [Bacillus mojavensis subgroup]MCR6596493.1 SUKH-4 family immunity protein [Bacillus halotolerans]MCY8105324.1 SUKH-4 family immunity protein [Bacillus mojavensis]MCY8482648.1 SUKH-4 family immunity protein [Bacillus mojavensis]MCY8510958.1 SUKH-4 family immunity protein [Bacillus mojavensis]MEC1775436.1 SUKH-4 family immunity protein [Bacillus mojavensis]